MQALCAEWLHNYFFCINRSTFTTFPDVLQIHHACLVRWCSQDYNGVVWQASKIADLYITTLRNVTKLCDSEPAVKKTTQYHRSHSDYHALSLRLRTCSGRQSQRGMSNQTQYSDRVHTEAVYYTTGTAGGRPLRVHVFYTLFLSYVLQFISSFEVHNLIR